MALVLPGLYATTCGCGCEAYEFYYADEVPLVVPWTLLVIAYTVPPSVFGCIHGRAPTNGLGVDYNPWVERGLLTFFERS
eukprot:4867934-Pyramimonas_sp.AAC.1